MAVDGVDVFGHMTSGWKNNRDGSQKGSGEYRMMISGEKKLRM